MIVLRRWARCAPAIVFACALAAHPASSQTLATSAQGVATEIDGRVIDRQTGLAISGVTVSVVGASTTTTSDEHGDFRITGLQPGTYTLRITRTGYQPSDTDPLAVVTGSAAALTLSLQAAATGSRLRTIGRTSTTSAGALQSAATI